MKLINKTWSRDVTFYKDLVGLHKITFQCNLFSKFFFVDSLIISFIDSWIDGIIKLSNNS